MTIKNPKTIQKKSNTHTAHRITDTLYAVTSGHSGSTYRVTFHSDGGATCSCKWGSQPSRRFSGCSHVLAAIAARVNRKVSAWTQETDALRQHRPVQYIGDGVIVTTRA